MDRVVAFFYLLLRFVTSEISNQINANTTDDDKFMTHCTLITYNDNISLVWSMHDNQIRKCIQEIRNASSQEIHAAPDDKIDGLTHFFYILDDPFALKDSACFSNETTDKIYSVAVACMNFTESSDSWNDTEEYDVSNDSLIPYANFTSTTMKAVPEKWVRLVRVGLAGFSVFLAAIIICAILFLSLVLLKCLQRILFVRQMPTPQYSFIKHRVADERNEDMTQESSYHNSTVHYEQKMSASKLLHLKDLRLFVGCFEKKKQTYES